MRKYLLAAVAALAFGGSAFAQDANPAHPQLGQRLRLLRPKHVHAPVIRY